MHQDVPSKNMLVLPSYACYAMFVPPLCTCPDQDPESLAQKSQF